MSSAPVSCKSVDESQYQVQFKVPVPSDIDIAQSVTPRPILQVCTTQHTDTETQRHRERLYLIQNTTDNKKTH